MGMQELRVLVQKKDEEERKKEAKSGSSKKSKSSSSADKKKKSWSGSSSKNGNSSSIAGAAKTDRKSENVVSKSSVKKKSEYSYPATEKKVKEIQASVKRNTETPTYDRKVITSKNYTPKKTQSIKDESNTTRRALLKERELYKAEKNPALTGLASGLSLGLTDIARDEALKTFKANNDDYTRLSRLRETPEYKAGEMAGFVATSLVPYSAAAKAVGTSARVANAGSKIGKAVSKVPKVSEATADKVGRGIAKSLAADAIAGTPLDATLAIRQSTTTDESGSSVDKDKLIKNFAINAAVNAGAGAAFEVAAPAVKALLKKADSSLTGSKTPILKDGKQALVNTNKLKGKTVTAETPKTETVTAETPKTETVTAETPKTETVTAETPKTETVTAETPKTETVAETPKTETVTAETPKTRTVTAETPKTRTVTAETPKTETVTAETPKTKEFQPLGADTAKYKYKKKTSKLFTNTVQDSNLPDEVKSLDENLFATERTTNLKQKEMSKLRRDTDLEGERTELLSKDAASVNAEDFVTAMDMLSDDFAKAGGDMLTADFHNGVKLLRKMAEVDTQAGQVVQANKMYKNTLAGKLQEGKRRIDNSRKAEEKASPKKKKQVDAETDSVIDGIGSATKDVIDSIANNPEDALDSFLGRLTQILPKTKTQTGKTLREQYVESSANSIANRFRADNVKGESAPLQELYSRMTNTIKGWIRTDKKTPAQKESAINTLRKEVQDSQIEADKYEEVFDEAIRVAKEQYKDDAEALAKIAELEQIGLKGFSETTVNKAIKEIIADSGKTITDIVKMSIKTKEEKLAEIKEIILKDVGADEKTAQELLDNIDRQFKQIVNDRNYSMVQGILNKKAPQIKSAYQKYAETVNVSGQFIDRSKSVVSQALKDAGVEARKLIGESDTIKAEAKKKFIETATENLRKQDLDEGLVGEIIEQLSKDFDSKVADTAEKYLDKRFLNRSNKTQTGKKAVSDDIKDLIRMGAYDRDDILDVIREQNGLPVLSNEDIQRISEIMLKVEKETDSREIELLNGEIEKIISDKMAVTGHDRLRALQRISLLSSPKTLLVRNPAGNIIFRGLETVKDIPAVIADTAASKFTGTRTISANPNKYAAYASGLKKGIKEWSQDVKRGVDTSPSRSAYELPMGSTFKGTNPVTKVLASMEKFIKYSLSLGDRPFYQAAHDQAMQELKNLGKLDSISAEDAELWARERGLDAVFQNSSDFSTRMSNIRSALGYVGDIMIPFTQTPANIADKLIDYSPIGLIKAVANVTKGVTKGSFDQRKFADTIGRSFTGAGAIALGYLWAKSGNFIPDTYKNTDDYKLYEAQKFSGRQSYSIDTGDHYITIKNESPASALLIMGAEAYASGAKQEDLFNMIFQGAMSGIDAFFSQSLLSGVFETLSSESPSKAAQELAINAMSQAVPTSLKQLAKTIDPYARETSDNNALRQGVKQAMSGIPGLSTLLPKKYDITGKEAMNNQGRNAVSRFLENLIFPETISAKNRDTVNNTLMALYDQTGNSNVLLRKAYKTIRYGDNQTLNLTSKQISEYQRMIGSEAYANISSFISSSAYKNMSNEDRASVISKINQNAENNAKTQILISAGKVTQDEWLNSLSEEKKKIFEQGVTGMSAMEYTKLCQRVAVDCDIAGGDSNATRAMAFAKEGANSSVFKAYHNDGKNHNYYLADAEQPARLLTEKGYTASDLKQMSEDVDNLYSENTNKKVTKKAVLESYARSVSNDREVRLAICRLLYSYSRNDKGELKTFEV